MLHLLTLSGTLAGLCVTGVALFHIASHPTWSETVTDDALAISALLLLLVLASMVGSGIIMVCTIR
ncbi:MAG: hypothetical protein ABL902_01860 [Gallionella sp.]|nr:hypothetical protein [Gallionella sp.]